MTGSVDLPLSQRLPGERQFVSRADHCCPDLFPYRNHMQACRCACRQCGSVQCLPCPCQNLSFPHVLPDRTETITGLWLCEKDCSCVHSPCTIFRDAACRHHCTVLIAKHDDFLFHDGVRLLRQDTAGHDTCCLPFPDMVKGRRSCVIASPHSQSDRLVFRSPVKILTSHRKSIHCRPAKGRAADGSAHILCQDPSGAVIYGANLRRGHAAGPQCDFQRLLNREGILFSAHSYDFLLY